MFCPKCGIQNLDTSRFCKKCGKPLPNRAQAARFHAPNLIGQVLDGRYRIEARLGSGGMGDVYRATRLLIGDKVALKLLHAHLASNPQAAERFRHEAVTATKLRHRNVVALYDVGISAMHNVPYLLMEFAEGLTLRQIMNHQRVLPLDFAVTVVAQVCAALEEAHRLDIVHRDIKPENIIANQTANGWHVKVLDFGIAKLYNEASSGLTQEGTAMGTPQYMSPEQCMGEPLDGRSDIYSVGIVLYEMLCGTVPFKSATASAVAIYQVQTAPRPPAAINPDIAPEVESVILRALSKPREMRQQSSQMLAQEFIHAATTAFKSGNLTASKVEAPKVEETEISSPPLANKISAPEEKGSGDESVPTQTAPAKKIKEHAKAKKANKGRKRKEKNPAADATIGIKPESKEPTFKVNEAGAKTLEETSPMREDLSLVFEDAESILDEIFPDEKREGKGISEPTAAAKATVLEESESIPMPAEKLPPIQSE